MTQKIFFILILFSFKVHATTYYISIAGNDKKNGISPTSSWKTLNRLNLIFGSLMPGDSVLLNRGDTFYGNIIINKSGNPSQPIYIGAYGNGTNPVITGFTTVSTWTNLGKNIWESSTGISNLSTCNMVAVSGNNTAMGRIPNTGYYTYESFSGSNQVTGSSLNSSVTDWTGAEVVVRKGNEYTDRCLIISQSGSTLTFSDLIRPTTPSVSGYGFFIENDIRTLDAQNEWYYNSSTKKISVYSSGMPANFQAATIGDLVSCKGFDYITFDGINFTGANHDCLYFTGNTNNITIQNCMVNLSGNDGIEATNGNYDKVTHCTINNSAKAGILLLGSYGEISYNTITNSSVIDGQADNGTQGDGIYDDSHEGVIQYNVIRNTGSNGIFYRSKIFRIDHNWIDSTLLLNTDNGGIYTAGIGIQRVIDHNIVTNVIGNKEGTPKGDYSVGIYLDESCSNTVVTNNTVANCGNTGIKIHISANNRIDSNTCFNNGHYQLLLHNGSNKQLLLNDTIEYNILFSKTFTPDTKFQWVLGVTDLSNSITGIGPIDNNYYVRPVDENNTVVTQVSASGVIHTFSDWKNFSNKDANSHNSPKTITDVNDIKFLYNPTTSTETIHLSSKYIDARGTVYSGSISLAPYTSAVLIKNN